MGTMAKKTKPISDPFAAALDRHMRLKGLTNDDLGLAVGYKNGKMISSIRLGKTAGSEVKRREIAKEFGFTLDEFIGKGEEILSAPAARCASPGSPAKLSDRQRVATRFQNQAAGEAIVRDLVEIERIDPAALIYFQGAVAERLQTLKERIGPMPGPQERSSSS